MTTQRVRFVGGNADGLRDDVDEISPGQLPQDLETMGSLYRLKLLPHQDSEYCVQGWIDGHGAHAPEAAGPE